VNWYDSLRPEQLKPQPPSRSAVNIAKELDAYNEPQVPTEMDIAEPVIQPPLLARDFKAVILRTISAATATSCAITSVYFSYLWFIASQPRFIASIMSVTIVATLTTAPELSITLARKKSFAGAFIVMAIALVAMLFSMSSTVGGIYNARTESVRVEAVASRGEEHLLAESSGADATIALLQERIQRLSTALETDQQSVASYQGSIDRALAEGVDPSARSVQLFVSNRNYAINRANVARQTIQEAEERIAVLLPVAASGSVQRAAEAKAERKDFNLWLGERFGVSQDQMEFIMAVFPAIFIDVVAPAMLAVAFSL
jgi:hypothetical protein